MLEIIIHKNILNFLGFEESLYDIPILFDIQFFTVFHADVADIDIATGLV